MLRNSADTEVRDGLRIVISPDERKIIYQLIIHGHSSFGVPAIF